MTFEIKEMIIDILKNCQDGLFDIFNMIQA